MEQELRIGRHAVTVTHCDKVLYPKAGCTKWDIAQYYARVGEYMVPYMNDRALTLQRYPNGIREAGFVQQHAQQHFPSWVRTAKLKQRAGKTMVHIIGRDAATLVYLAQLGTVDVHAWLSRRDRPEKPDRLVFDLDPPGRNFDLVRFGAQKIKAYADTHDVPAYVMTTGSKGLHVVIPLKRGPTFDTVRDVAKKIAQELADAHPEKLTTELSKKKRKGRLFLDMTRNAYGQTSIVPYSLRGLPGAPVATPLTWREIGQKHVHAQFQTIATIEQRLKRRGDVWQSMKKDAVRLSKVL